MQQQLQLALQLACAVAFSSLPVFIRSLYFSLACLSGIFVIIIHVLLVANHHVGTLLLSSANMLGATWAGAAAAGIMVSVTLQIPSHTCHLVALAVLASAGFAVFTVPRVATGSAHVSLQRTNLLLLFSMSLVLSVSASSTRALWLSLSHIMLAFALAAAASTISGCLILPSLATDAAVGLAAKALCKTGNTATMCVSILLRPEHEEIPRIQSGTAGEDKSPRGRTTTWQLKKHHMAAAAAAVAGAGEHNFVPPVEPQGLSLPSGAAQQALCTVDQQQTWTSSDSCSSASSTSSSTSADSSGEGAEMPFPCGFQDAVQDATAAAAAVAPAAQGAAATPRNDAQPAAAGADTDPETAQVSSPRPTQLHMRPSLLTRYKHYSSSSADQASSIHAAATASARSLPAAAAAGAAPGQSPVSRGSLDLHRRSGLVFELGHRRSSEAASELELIDHVTRPGQWGIKSYVTAESQQSLGSARDQAAVAAAEAGGTAKWSGKGQSHAAAGDDSSPAGSLHSRCTAPFAAGHSAAASLTAAAAGESRPATNSLLYQRHSQQAGPRVPHAGHDQKQQWRPKQQQQKPAGRYVARKEPQQPKQLLPQQQQAAVDDHQQQQQQQQQHLFVQLARGIDYIRPLIADLKAFQDALTVEQSWRVRIAVGLNPTAGHVDAQHWKALVEALESLLNRFSALEGMLEGGPNRASLSHLTSYKTLRDASGLVIAQAAALCAELAVALDAQHKQRQQLLLSALMAVAAGIASRFVRWCNSRSAMSGQPSDLSCSSYCRCTCNPGQDRLTDHDQGLEPGRRSRPHLNHGCRRSLTPVDWQQLRGQLVSVLELEHQQYYAELAVADHLKPFMVDPARGVQGVMFLGILAVGVVDAAERLHAAGQTVLDSQSMSLTVTMDGQQPQQYQIIRGGGGRVEAAAPPAASDSDVGGSGGTAKAGQPIESPGTPCCHCCSGSSNVSGSEFIRLSPSTSLLLDLLLCLSVWRCLHAAFFHKLRGVMRAPRAGFWSLFHQRRFQAGVKVWLSLSVALVVIILLSRWQPQLPPNLMMLGILALLYCMKERVESSTEMVIVRVFSTVLGASIGELLMFSPASAEQPWALALTLVCAASILSPAAATQFKLMLCLGLVNLNAVVLCQYMGCCGSHGTVSYYVGRILATGGGALFAVVMNRVLWPWRRDQWALESMTEVLQIGLSTAQSLYNKEYQYVRELTGHSEIEGASGTGTVGCSQTQVANPVGESVGLMGLGTGQQAAVGFNHQSLDLESAESGQVSIRIPAAAATAAAVSHSAVGDKQQQQQQQQHKAITSDISQQQRRMQSLLGPVQIAVARDTVMHWKWTQLATPKVVPLMLAAVQQLTEALAAMKVVTDLVHQTVPVRVRDQQQQQPGHMWTYQWQSAGMSAMAPATIMGGPPGEQAPVLPDLAAAASLEESENPIAGNWRSLLLYNQLASVLHADLLNIFSEVTVLLQLVQQATSRPTAAHKELLQHKIVHTHKLRVEFNKTYIMLRNRRHENLRTLFGTLMQHRQVVHRLRAVQVPDSYSDTASEALSPRSSESADARTPSAAAAGSAPASCVNGPVSIATPAAAVPALDLSPQSSPQSAVSTLAAALDARVPERTREMKALGQRVIQELFFSNDSDVLRMDLAVVQYAAFVYSLRRVLNRALAAARCVAEAE